MKLFTFFAGSRLYHHRGSFDTETLRAIFFMILAVVGILAAFGLIKYLIHFYKLPRKDKKEELFTIPIAFIGLFGLTYFILYFTFPAAWDVNIRVVSVVFLVFVSLFLAAIVFDDSILEKTDPEVEKKESEEANWNSLKNESEKYTQKKLPHLGFSKKPNKKIN